MLDTAACLARFGHAGPTTPTLPTLRALHHAQMLTVPFENLDIGLGRPIVLDERSLFATVSPLVAHAECRYSSTIRYTTDQE